LGASCYVKDGSKKDINQYTAELNLNQEAIDVGSEGNCQFKIVSDQYYGDAKYYQNCVVLLLSI
jgi:hypothetical protein